MAKNVKLDEGFEEVPVDHSLDEGFQEVPLDQPSLDDAPYMMGESKSPIDLMSKVSTSPTVQEIRDFGRGAAQGVTMGGGDELMGALQSTGDIITGKLDPTKDLYAKYREYQKIQEAKNKAAEERSPVGYTGGQIFGSMVPGVLSSGAGLGGEGLAATQFGKGALKASLGEILEKQGAGAFLKEAGKRAGVAGAEMVPVGATEGALYSEGGLATPEEQKKLLADAASGAALGGILGSSFKGVGDVVPPVVDAGVEKIGQKISQHVADSPYLRQMKIAKEMGEQGVNFGSEAARLEGTAGQAPLFKREQNFSEDLFNRMKTVDEEYGKAIGKSLDDATNAGVKVDIGDDVRHTATSLGDYFDRNPAINTDPQSSKAFFQMLSSNKEMTPLEVKTAINKMDDVLDNLKGDNSLLANQTRKSVSDFRNRLDARLRMTIEGYDDALKNFSQFREAIPDTIQAKQRSTDAVDVWGSLDSRRRAIEDATRQMVEGATKGGTAKRVSGETFINLMNKLKELEQTNPEALKKMGFKNADDMLAYIKRHADESAAVNTALGVNPQGSPMETLKKGAIGAGSTGAGLPITLANKYGLMKRRLKVAKSPAELSRNVFQSTDESLKTMAVKLKNVPGLKKLGETLENGLNNKDVAAKNAAVFLILQNPDARKLLQEDDEFNIER